MEPLHARYPFDLVDVWHARDGERVLVRPVHPQDLELAQAFVRELSPESRYNRFHGALKELTPGMARWATHVDYDRHLALIAAITGTGARSDRRSGTARRRETAEFAGGPLEQGQGLGARLLSDLMRVAAGRGLRWMEGEVLASNRGMLALSRRLGFDYRKPHRDARLVTVSRRLREQDARGTKRVFPGWRGWLRTLGTGRFSAA
jgi:acetyltransferase